MVAPILSDALLMASWTGMEVYSATTSRLNGYGNCKFSKALRDWIALTSL